MPGLHYHFIIFSAYSAVIRKNISNNSICPLGFTAVDAKGREKNYNYYDSPELTAAVREYIIRNIKEQVSLGVNTETCFCFGTGKTKNSCAS